MGDRLVQTFRSVRLFLQVPLAGNCKLATLHAEKKTMYETQIILHLLWCNKLKVILGLKLGVKTEVKLEVKL